MTNPEQELMRSVRVHGAGNVTVDWVPAPIAAADEVVVRVAACGICGTDLKVIRSGGRAGDQAGPMPLGHEVAGIVEQVGSAVSGVAVGQRVVVNPIGRHGVIGYGAAEGAFSDLLRVRNAVAGGNLLPVPDALPLHIAALTEPLAVALHAVNRAVLSPKPITPATTAVVFGAGPIGLGIVLWLAQKGIANIIAVDPHPARLQLATDFGAHHTAVARRDDVWKCIGAVHGRGSSRAGAWVGSDLFFDSAGAPALLGEIIDHAKPNSVLITLATYSAPLAVNFEQLLRREMWITTAAGYGVEFADALAALIDVRSIAERMISARIGLDCFEDALLNAFDRNASKVIVEFPPAR